MISHGRRRSQAHAHHRHRVVVLQEARMDLLEKTSGDSYKVILVEMELVLDVVEDAARDVRGRRKAFYGGCGRHGSDRSRPSEDEGTEGRAATPRRGTRSL